MMGGDVYIVFMMIVDRAIVVGDPPDACSERVYIYYILFRNRYGSVQEQYDDSLRVLKRNLMLFTSLTVASSSTIKFTGYQTRTFYIVHKFNIIIQFVILFYINEI